MGGVDPELLGRLRVPYWAAPLLMTGGLIASLMASLTGAQPSHLIVSTSLAAAFVGGLMEFYFLMLLEYLGAGEARARLRTVLVPALLTSLYFTVIGAALICYRVSSIARLRSGSRCLVLGSPLTYLLVLLTLGALLVVVQACASREVARAAAEGQALARAPESLSAKCYQGQ